jgi:hypothetical protein
VATTPAAVTHAAHHTHHRTRTHRKAKHATVVVAPTRKPPTRAAAPAAVPAPTKVLHPSSSSGLLWMVLVALAVLLIGGLAAVALSRAHARAADPGLTDAGLN